jgi:hypothetical protein
VRHELRESHRDERRFHDEAITQLQAEHRCLQGRIDAMYEDKLDGQIANGPFSQRGAEMRAAQAAIMREMEAHQPPDRQPQLY